MGGPEEKARHLATVLLTAADGYSAAKREHASALVNETQAAARWTVAANRHGVGSAEEIGAFADWAGLAEETELADALLNMVRITLRRTRRAIPAPAAGARA